MAEKPAEPEPEPEPPKESQGLSEDAIKKVNIALPLQLFLSVELDVVAYNACFYSWIRLQTCFWKSI